jgi:hypothetical protein
MDAAALHRRQVRHRGPELLRLAEHLRRRLRQQVDHHLRPKRHDLFPVHRRPWIAQRRRSVLAAGGGQDIVQERPGPRHRPPPHVHHHDRPHLRRRRHPVPHRLELPAQPPQRRLALDALPHRVGQSHDRLEHVVEVVDLDVNQLDPQRRGAVAQPRRRAVGVELDDHLARPDGRQLLPVLRAIVPHARQPRDRLARRVVVADGDEMIARAHPQQQVGRRRRQRRDGRPPAARSTRFIHPSLTRRGGRGRRRGFSLAPAAQRHCYDRRHENSSARRARGSLTHRRRMVELPPTAVKTTG